MGYLLDDEQNSRKSGDPLKNSPRKDNGPTEESFTTEELLWMKVGQMILAARALGENLPGAFPVLVVVSEQLYLVLAIFDQEKGELSCNQQSIRRLEKMADAPAAADAMVILNQPILLCSLALAELIQNDEDSRTVNTDGQLVKLQRPEGRIKIVAV